jgi:hypothetical protein
MTPRVKLIRSYICKQHLSVKNLAKKSYKIKNGKPKASLKPLFTARMKLVLVKHD